MHLLLHISNPFKEHFKHSKGFLYIWRLFWTDYFKWSLNHSKIQQMERKMQKKHNENEVGRFWCKNWPKIENLTWNQNRHVLRSKSVHPFKNWPKIRVTKSHLKKTKIRSTPCRFILDYIFGPILNPFLISWNFWRTFWPKFLLKLTQFLAKVKEI